MNQNCVKCSNTPDMVTELLNLYRDGDPIRTMELLMDLTDLGTRSGILNDDDRYCIAQLNHVLGAVAHQRENDNLETINMLKASA